MNTCRRKEERGLEEKCVLVKNEAGAWGCCTKADEGGGEISVCRVLCGSPSLSAVCIILAAVSLRGFVNEAHRCAG